MATAICMLLMVMIAFVAAPWVADMNHGSLHRVDMMAGGEGIE